MWDDTDNQRETLGGVVKTKHCRSLVTVKAVFDMGGLHPLIFLGSQAMLRPRLRMLPSANSFQYILLFARFRGNPKHDPCGINFLYEFVKLMHLKVHDNAFVGFLDFLD
jgi:hypothetical protein